MRPPPFRRVASFTGALLLIATAPAQTTLPAEPPSPKLVRERAVRELPVWLAHLPASRPRLFFSADSWAALRARYTAATGLERTYFDAVLLRARRLAERPVAEYRPPEEMARLRPGLTATDADQELWQRPVGDGIVALSLALALENDDAIRAKLHETVLAACAYPRWGVAHPNQDLAAGHIARGIAIAYDWHPGLWSEADRTLIRATIRVRMEAMKAATYGGIYWSGRYDENHNHVSVAGLGLCGLAFLGEIPEAAEWTALALTNFESVARESHADGSSDEGVPYWSYGLSFVLQYIEGTRHVLGTGDLYAAPFFRHAVAHRLHASTPDLAGALPWGDAPARDYYGPHHLLYRLAAEYRDGTGQNLANHLPFGPGGGADCIAWTALWYDRTLPETPPEARDHHAAVGGIVTTRSGWGANDYLLSFKAGFTNRNHSHLDAGALAWSFGHDWLLTTPGYGHGSGEPDYWQKDGGRWTYLSNATEAESTLLINGHNQRFTTAARGRIDSFVTGPGWMWTSADLTTAYDEIDGVRRDVLHRRGDYVLVFDTVTSTHAVTTQWLAQVPPAALLGHGQLTVKSLARSLVVRPLLPATLEFTTRLPTSPHADVSPDRLKTYALTQSGTTTHFAVLLAPSLGAAPPRLQNLGSVETAAGQKFTLTGTDWEDQITVNFSPGANSRVTATRRIHDHVDSILAIGATQLDGAGPALRFAAAVDLSLQLTPDGAWLLDAGTTLDLVEPIPPGWQLTPLLAEPTPAATDRTARHLPAGRYVLLPPGQTAAAVRSWLGRP